MSKQNKTDATKALSDLGYSEEAQAKIEAVIHCAGRGSVTIAGPVGSGKSEHLHSLLASMKRGD